MSVSCLQYNCIQKAVDAMYVIYNIFSFVSNGFFFTTEIKLNEVMDKKLHTLSHVGCNYSSMPRI